MNAFKQNRYAPVPLFLAAAVFILAGPIFWIGVEAPGRERVAQPAENSDLFQQISPGMHYGFSRIRAGDFPLWNDQQLCGAPFFADPRHGLLQPLNAVFLFFDAPRAMALHALMALALMGFFFVLFLRAMNARYVSAVVGGIVYVCCGATAAVMSRPGYVNALVWLPLLCCLIREYMRRPIPALKGAGGIVTAFLLLSGAPLLTFAALLTAYGYGLCAALFGLAVSLDVAEHAPDDRRWTRLKGLAVMAGLGLALSAVQWAPTLVWVRGLEEPAGFLTQFDVAGEVPHNLRSFLTQLLAAHAVRLPAAAYFGISSLLLLPAAFFHSVPRWERACLAAIAFGCIALAVASIQTPASTGAFLVLIYPAAFVIAVLVALGADRLFAARRDPMTPRLWGPLLLVTVVFALLFIIAPDATRGRMLPFAAAVAFFAVFRTRWAGLVSGIVLLIFLYVDLSTSTINQQPHPFFSQQSSGVVDARLATLLRDTALDDRLLVSTYPNNTRIHANIGLSDGLRMAGAAGLPLTPEQGAWWRALGVKEAGDDFSNTGGEAGFPARLDVSGTSPYVSLLNVMAVRAVATTEGGGLHGHAPAGMGLRRRGEYDDVAVYANEDVLPRIAWAPSWQIALDINAAIEAVSNPAFDSRKECIVVPADAALGHLMQIMPDQRPPSASAPAFQASPSRLRLIEDKPEHVVIEVHASMPGIAILGDTWDPGWHAYLNGQESPILRVNGLFRGIALPPGEHVITFRYRPKSVYIGALLSLISVIVLLVRGGRMLADYYSGK